jgi:alpha-1,2-mannosyltransferase
VVLSRERELTRLQIALVCAGWLAFAVSAFVYVRVSVWLNQPFHEGLRHLRYFDLKVYRGAAQRIVDGQGLYGRPIRLRLGFTYPPTAALLMVPLTWFSIRGDELIVTALNGAALIFALRQALLIARPSERRSSTGTQLSLLSRPAVAWSVAAVAAGAAIWLEPVSVAFGYGQVDILIAALVVFDVARDDSARTKGLAIGLAAGIKLTPLLFIPYLLLSGRRRAAIIASASFVVTVVASFVLVPADAARYWEVMVFRTSRIGGAADVANQSLRGAIARLLDVWHPGMAATVTVALVAAVGIGLAVHFSRRGDDAAGFSLCAVTTLLTSPISWTHHWVLAIPALFMLIVVGWERRSLPLLASAVALLYIGYSYLPERVMAQHGSLMHDGSPLRVDPYVVIGLLVLAVAGVNAILNSGRRPIFGRVAARRRSLRVTVSA